MTANPHDLERLVLQAVLDDYRSFEWIAGRLTHEFNAGLAVIDLERILLSSIARNLVAAYLIHADPPYATKVNADLANIRTFWFWITEEGQKHLRRVA